MTEPMDDLSLPDIFWTLMGEEEADFLESEALTDLFSKKLWTMKNGEIIPINEMSDHHLINTLAMVGEENPWHSVLQEELNHRINKVPSVAKINIEKRR